MKTAALKYMKNANKLLSGNDNGSVSRQNKSQYAHVHLLKSFLSSGGKLQNKQHEVNVTKQKKKSQHQISITKSSERLFIDLSSTQG